MSDLRFSIWSPSYATNLRVDASADVAHGTNTWEDTPDGCGAAKINLGLYYEDIYARGVWSALNIVEIYSGDNYLTSANSAVSAGNSGTYFVDSIWGFDPARGEDQQYAYFYDGINLAMRCKVTGYGLTGGAYVPYSTSAAGTGSSFSKSITTPTSGEVLICIITTATGVTISTAPSGYTLVGSSSNGAQMFVYKKTATGSETTVGATFSASTAYSLNFYTVQNGGAVAVTFDNTQSGPEVSSPPVSTNIGGLVIAAFTIQNGGNLQPVQYGWSPTSFVSATGSGSATAPLYSEYVYASDTNPYLAVAGFVGMAGIGAVCATITVASSSSTPSPYIVVSTPTSGGGIPAYAAQTIVGRRRYTGRVWMRQRGNEKVPSNSVTLKGLASGLDQAVGNFICQATANVDIGTAVYDCLNLFATQLPFLTIAAGNFPLLGQVYSGTSQDTTVDSIIGTILQQISTLDGWYLRVGHDATPRLVRLYIGAKNQYVYGITLSQGSIENYDPTQLEVDDSDCSNVYNRIKVIGDNDAATGLPVSAIVDGSAGSPYGLVLDGTPVQIQGLKTVAECASAAQSLLNQNSIASSNQKFRIYTKNDQSASGLGPGNMQNGDIVRAVALTTIANFNTATYQSTMYTPPAIYGLGLSVVTTFDNETGDHYQDVQFQAIEPDFNEAMAEAKNAVATALKANTQTGAGLDEYFVSSLAYPFSVSGLVVTAPAFQAVFALGSNPVVVGGNNFTLSANATNWAWLNPSNTWTITTTANNILGAIPYAVFTTNATGVVGFQPLAQIGLLAITGTYLLSTAWTPTVTGTIATPVSSVNGLAAAISLTFTITNQVTDGSFARIGIWYRIHGTTTWSPAFSIDAITGSTSQTYSGVLVGNLTVGALYDFGITVISTGGNESAVVSITSSINAGLVAIGASYQIGGATSLTPTVTSVTDSNVASVNGLTAAVYIKFTLTNQPTDTSLSRINYWYQPSAIANGVNTPGASNFAWLPAGGVLAAGVGSASPSASATYSVAFDVAPSVAYNFAVSYEDTQGGESTLAALLSNYTATSSGIPAPYLLEGTLSTPTVTGPSGTGSPALTVSIAGKYTSQLQIEFMITNQPVDGSLVKIICYYRQSGQTYWLQFATNAPQNGIGTPLSGGATSVTGLYLFLYTEAANGITYEFGVAMESNRGSETSVTSLGTISKGLHAASGTTITVGSVTETNNGGNAAATSYNVTFSVPYTIAGTSDTSWVDHWVIGMQYYNPGFSYPTQPIVSIPATSPSLTGTLSFSIQLVQNASFSGPTTTFSYYFTLAAVAADGSQVNASGTWLFTHA